MSINRIIITLAGILLLSGGGAFAFKEVTPKSGETALHGKAQEKSAENLAQSFSSKDAAEENTNKGGIVLSIPGIGRLGTLPKLDFGLELLYGANEEDPVEETIDDDVTIKGSVKHKF